MMKNGVETRPDFRSAEHWLDHFEKCRKAGGNPWEPATRDELLLAEECGLLKIHPEWIPGPEGLRLLELPRDFGRRKAFPEEWQERFLFTISEDVDFRDALRALLSRTPAIGGEQCL